MTLEQVLSYHISGSWKNSLLGSDNIYGMDDVRFYTRIKTITSRRPSGAKEEILFSIPIKN